MVRQGGRWMAAQVTFSFVDAKLSSLPLANPTNLSRRVRYFLQVNYS